MRLHDSQELAIDDSPCLLEAAEPCQKNDVCDIAARFSLLVEVLSNQAESGRTGFDTEFQKLSEVDRALLSNDSEFSTAKLPSNLCKNRYNNILASMPFCFFFDFLEYVAFGTPWWWRGRCGCPVNRVVTAPGRAGQEALTQHTSFAKERKYQAPSIKTFLELLFGRITENLGNIVS